MCPNKFEVTAWFENKIFSCSAECRWKRHTLKKAQSRLVEEQPEDHKLIRVPTGEVVLVSNEDYEVLRDLPWCLNSRGYVGGRQGMLHRVIMERTAPIPKGYVVDHINRNRLDNRRVNLRLATRGQNNTNQRLRGGSSKYLGVSKASKSTWKSYVSVDGRMYVVGFYDDELEGAWMRDQWALALHGEFAVLNFDYK
ncbi:HNH endonuclease [Pseudarthrobacter sp902506025]|uniref:HNH endonuclease n=1 Tax=Pseudarthrobacter sp. 902506025 TaxID=3155291 RepID=UPI00344CF5C2